MGSQGDDLLQGNFMLGPSDYLKLMGLLRNIFSEFFKMPGFPRNSMCINELDHGFALLCKSIGRKLKKNVVEL